MCYSNPRPYARRPIRHDVFYVFPRIAMVGDIGLGFKPVYAVLDDRKFVLVFCILAMCGCLLGHRSRIN